jgi:two-component system, NtrC family, sensor histidine kinase HydH
MTRKRLISIGISALAFAALSVGFRLILGGMSERNRLESRNDAETTFSVLFASLRRYEDFGTAIEATENLASKVLGVGVYEADGKLLYSWGQAPPSYKAPAFDGADVQNDMARLYVPNAKNSSLILLLSPSRGDDKPPPPPEDERKKEARHEHPFMFETLRDAGVIFLEIRQPKYWQRERLQDVLSPVIELILAALVISARFLILKNDEYRRRIEEQKNLVVLGTAASTLAHEIKNPLLAIRLQTSILSRTLKGEGQRELEIIDSEVARLSSLSNRVGDYLRDPAGNPALVDPREIANEVLERLCGHGLPEPTGRCRMVKIDPERLRSILENLVRNALESGGDESEVSIELSDADLSVHIDVLDRGSGIPTPVRDRLFDPFFTTKSKGSGIGLAICRRFAQAAHGSIVLENRHGGGARARLVLRGVTVDAGGVR